MFAVSPRSRLLTWLGRTSGNFISWDLQTGVPVSEITVGEGRSAQEARSITYSECGTMFGVLFKGRNATAIGTCKVSHSPETQICYHSVEGPVIDTIWTHGECVRFATLEPWVINIWEIGFTSEVPAAEVDSLCTPGNFDPSREFVLLPSRFLLAFVLENTVMVWDGKTAKFLLKSADVREPRKMTFSPDGRFVACATNGPEIHLWKESPSGYIPHRVLVSGTGESSVSCEPLFSPNGQSIAVFGGPTLQLWRTMDSAHPPSSISNQASRPTKRFILGFSPDESLAAAARLADDTVTVLDLKSGDTRFVIDTGMKVYGLRVAENTIAVVGEGKIVYWALPAGDSAPNARVNVNDCVRQTTFEHSTPPEFPPMSSASISTDFNHIAVADMALGLRIYHIATGKYLVGAESGGDMPWFTPDGHEVWCRSSVGEAEGWAIGRRSGSDVTGLQDLDPTGGPPGGFPWKSHHGYKTEDGWMVNSNGKQLLWLPPHWRSGETYRVWGGRFLALLHPELPEVVVLELLEERPTITISPSSL